MRDQSGLLARLRLEKVDALLALLVGQRARLWIELHDRSKRQGLRSALVTNRQTPKHRHVKALKVVPQHVFDSDDVCCAVRIIAAHVELANNKPGYALQ